MRVAPSLPLRKEVLNKELKAHAQRAKFDIGMRQHHNGQARACATYSNQGPNQGSVLQATCLHQNDTVGDGTLPYAHLPHAYASSGEAQGRGPAYCAGSNSVPAKGSATQSLAQSLADMHPAEAVPVYVMLPLDTVNAQGVFRYAYIPWFAQALQVLALSGVHGVAVDVWVSDDVSTKLRVVHRPDSARPTARQQEQQQRVQKHTTAGACCWPADSSQRTAGLAAYQQCSAVAYAWKHVYVSANEGVQQQCL
eukprot:GHRQ01023005.1.p1 GENE.GHRQ01023005.1~~GHRQ01023005.1.p1  ORF type:complete len:252 (+),score=40.23 GHRQ01023005.1:382-1137(+)